MAPIVIRAAGLVCGVGFDAAASCAAIRSAIDNFVETEYADSGGEPLIGSCVPIGFSWPPLRRVRQMLASAVSECLNAVPSASTPLPLLLCVAEQERPGRLEGLDDELFGQLETELDRSFERAASRVFPYGRVSALLALSYARELIHEHRFENVLIAGADSLLTRRTIRAFERTERLRTSRNSNGFIPGEAGSAVLVGAGSSWSDGGLACVGLGQSSEQAGIESEQPLRAEGLTEAIRAAVADAQRDFADLDFRITDNSGEQYYFKEGALAVARLLRARKEDFDIWHPADCIGEVGAAIGPAMLAVAMFAGMRGYAPGAAILCHAGNDSGVRAAAILQLPEAP